MQRNKPEIVEVDNRKLEALLERAEQQAFETEDYETIRAVLESYFYVTNLIDQKSTTLARLRKLLFGDRTEKTSQVIGQQGEASGVAEAGESSATFDHGRSRAEQQADASDASRSKRKGHGRNGADDYPGAIRVEVPLESLAAGRCVSRMPAGNGLRSGPARRADPLRRPGAGPSDGLPAAKAALWPLRQAVYGRTARGRWRREVRRDGRQHDRPAEIRERPALQPHAKACNGIWRFRLPASTQWDIVSRPGRTNRAGLRRVDSAGGPGRCRLQRRHDRQDPGTDGRARPASGSSASLRPTSKRFRDAEAAGAQGHVHLGHVSTRDGRRIALFFSGRPACRREPARKCCCRRAAESGRRRFRCATRCRGICLRELETIVAHCLAHGRRQFVDVARPVSRGMPHVLESLSVIYHNDAHGPRAESFARGAFALSSGRERSDDGANSTSGLKRQFDERLVEPNSGLGGAISYLLQALGEADAVPARGRGAAGQ